MRAHGKALAALCAMRRTEGRMLAADLNRRLAVVIDLFSRLVVGWSMRARMDRELVLNALLMAHWYSHELKFTALF